jgi:hypothetical protein
MDEALRVLRSMRDPDDDADEPPEGAPDFPGDVDDGLEVPGQPDEDPDYDDEDVDDWEPDADPDDQTFGRQPMPMGLFEDIDPDLLDVLSSSDPDLIDALSSSAVKLPTPDLSGGYDVDDDDDQDGEDDDGEDDDGDDDEDSTDDDVGGDGWDQGPGSFDPKTAGGRGYCPRCGDEHDDPDGDDCPGVEVRAALRPISGQLEYR